LKPVSLNEQLRLAIERDHASTVRTLLAAGADPNSESASGRDRMLTYAIKSIASLTICRLLIEHGAVVNGSHDSGHPLVAAAAAGSTEVCKELVNRGADVNSFSEEDETPLHAAAGKGHTATCKYLISAGAQVNCANHTFRTALHYAVDYWDKSALATVHLLVAEGGDTSFVPTGANRGYLTPFQQAVRDSKESIVVFLIDECGEKASQLTIRGRTMPDLADNDDLAAILRAAITEEALADAVPAATAMSAPTPATRPSLGVL
jgi:ankyrin repeat protein